jgi:hypothetical protein
MKKLIDDLIKFVKPTRFVICVPIAIGRDMLGGPAALAFERVSELIQAKPISVSARSAFEDATSIKNPR